jgi:hypothetical protein
MSISGNFVTRFKQTSRVLRLGFFYLQARLFLIDLEIQNMGRNNLGEEYGRRHHSQRALGQEGIEDSKELRTYRRPM